MQGDVCAWEWMPSELGVIFLPNIRVEDAEWTIGIRICLPVLERGTEFLQHAACVAFPSVFRLGKDTPDSVCDASCYRAVFGHEDGLAE